VSKLNTESSSYTMGFLTVMVVIVGGMLALVSSALEETIDANKELDRRTKIMKAILSLPQEEEASTLTASFVNEEYENKVKGFLVNYAGDVVEELFQLVTISEKK
jgi:Na+-transporting NADH:ubiquinone oxidoreductase subunit NqrC